MLEVDPTVFLLYDGGLVRIVLVVLSILIGLHFHDLYSQFTSRSRIVLLQQLCLVMGVAFLMQGLIAYVNANLRVPIRVMVVGSALAVVAIFFWRMLFSAYALQVVGRDRLLLVGGSPLLEDIGQHIVEHPGERPGDRRLCGRPARDPATTLPGGKMLGAWPRCARSFAPPSPTASWWACSSGATACRWANCWNCASPATSSKRSPTPTSACAGGSA